MRIFNTKKFFLPIVLLEIFLCLNIFAQEGLVISSGTNMVVMGGTTTISGNLSIASEAVIHLYGNMTVLGTLANTAGNNGLVIKSSSDGTGSLIESTGISATVERYITQEVYHYISAPVTTQAISLLQSGTAHSDFDLFWYDEDYSGGGGPAWIDASAQGGSMEVALGYGYTYNPSDRTLGYTGTTNQGTITKTVSYTYDAGVSTSEWYFGWSMIGNPYPSRINATTFIDDTDNSNIYGTLYFWDEGSNYSNDRSDYSTWNKTGAVSGGGGRTPNGYIDVSQAFMVHYGSGTTQSSSSIKFKNDMRVHDEAQFFKNNENQGFKIALTNDKGDYNETLIGFVAGTTNGFDDKYDGYKLKGNPNISLYSKLLEDNGSDYAIQALPPITDGIEIKLGIFAGSEGIYQFNVVDIENFNDTTSIFLEDIQENITVNLRTTQNYSFLIDEEGNYNDRFLLKFNTSAVGIVDNNTISDNFNIYSAYGKIIIESFKPESTFDVFIYNSMGQLISTYKGSNKSEKLFYQTTGIYVVKIVTDNRSYSKKIFHNN